MVKKKTQTNSFEQSLAELEQLVEAMEGGEMSLEDSLKSFERGVELTRSCQQALKEAEQKVQILTTKTDQAEPEPFNRDE